MPWCSPLDLLAAAAQFGEDGFDAVLVDGTQGIGGNAQFHPTVFARHPEAALVQGRPPAAPGFVVGMRHIVARLRALAGYLADLRHTYLVLDLATLSQGSSGPAASGSRSGILAPWPERAAYYSRIKRLRQLTITICGERSAHRP